MNCNSCGNTLATISTALAIELTQGLSVEDQNILGNFFNALGQQICLLAATAESQKQGCQPKVPTENTPLKTGEAKKLSSSGESCPLKGLETSPTKNNNKEVCIR